MVLKSPSVPPTVVNTYHSSLGAICRQGLGTVSKSGAGHATATISPVLLFIYGMFAITAIKHKQMMKAFKAGFAGYSCFDKKEH